MRENAVQQDTCVQCVHTGQRTVIEMPATPRVVGAGRALRAKVVQEASLVALGGTQQGLEGRAVCWCALVGAKQGVDGGGEEVAGLQGGGGGCGKGRLQGGQVVCRPDVWAAVLWVACVAVWQCIDFWVGVERAFGRVWLSCGVVKVSAYNMGVLVRRSLLRGRGSTQS